jgi:addiction module HigA family antidote
MNALRRILLALDAATAPQMMDLPGFRFHPLKGRDKGRYAVTASGNYRITFAFDGEDAVEVDLGGLSLMSANRLTRGLAPMHPGELLREEVLPALNRPKSEIARLLGVSRQTLYDILETKQPVTPAMALRFGKLCGNGPDLWINLQKRYDLWRAEQEIGDQIADIPTLTAA